MRPQEFRRNLNALLQSLRSVVLLIERRKRTLADGVVWLAEWEKAAKKSKRYGWSIAARNRVVHEEDLRLHSTATIRFSRPSGEVSESVFDLQANVSPLEMISVILSGEPRRREGVLTVARRWIENSLPGDELLAVAAEVYEEVAKLVKVAHQRCSNGECDLDVDEGRECFDASHPFGRPSCMTLMESEMSVSVDVATRRLLTRKVLRVERDENAIEEGRRRYGEPRFIHGDPIERAEPMLELGVQFLLIDGERLPTFALFRGEKVIETWQPTLPESRDKPDLFERMAERIRVLDADGWLYASEIWLGMPDGTQPAEAGDGYYAQRPGSMEGLMVAAATADGRSLTLTQMFGRDEKGKPLMHEHVDRTPAVWSPMMPLVHGWDQKASRTTTLHPTSE
jgi:hypothetical protein